MIFKMFYSIKSVSDIFISTVIWGFYVEHKKKERKKNFYKYNFSQFNFWHFIKSIFGEKYKLFFLFYYLVYVPNLYKAFSFAHNDH
jgi:hypothetical protein